MSAWAATTWVPTIKWDSKAGGTLKAALAALEDREPVTLTVFGSAPLQLGVDEGLLSADIDIFEVPHAKEKLGKAGLLEGQTEIYVELCPPNTFRAAPDWQDRAHKEKHGHVTLVLPHPLDILISKLPRLEPKDIEAFLAVQAKTGHPTEGDLIQGLQNAVDIYRPPFDEEYPMDPIANTRIIWKRLFQKDIDVRKEIILPATIQRAQSYHPAPEAQSRHDQLGQIGKSRSKNKPGTR